MKPTNRFDALDALRGFAILTMVLSGVIPYRVLPDWMYHAQVPPPNHIFNPDLPGLTWVDLVFPMFLFALGAAIPIAMHKRIKHGKSIGALIFQVIERGFLLGFFAIFLQHVRPHVLHPHPTPLHWMIALLGFFLMFLIFMRLPKEWKSYQKLIIRAVGWIGAISLLSLITYIDGSGFSLYRSDIIIIVLTNMAVAGSLIWLCTRNHLLIRLGLLGILIAFRLSHTVPGWTQLIWNATPIPWLYQFYYLQYLFIVLPGTIIGDLINNALDPDKIAIDLPARRIIDLDNVKNFYGKQLEVFEHESYGNKPEPHAQSWSHLHSSAIIAIILLLLVGILVGLQERYVVQTTIYALLCCCLLFALIRHPNNQTEELIKKLFSWAAFWLVLGLIFEPYEGGIKKDHPTMSYYFVTTGLSIFLLMAFHLISQGLKRNKWIQLLVDNGKNPMIAYVGFANFIWPILALTGLEDFILAWTQHPWIGFIRGVIYTLLVALLVRVFSRNQIFWRT
ncbi:DUF5009 domain-containing protein [candidate division KSB1 bacterium]|nr:DUF5009 domain-containing protein [candidate division KSB1 bacterium]